VTICELAEFYHPVQITAHIPPSEADVVKITPPASSRYSECQLTDANQITWISAFNKINYPRSIIIYFPLIIMVSRHYNEVLIMMAISLVAARFLDVLVVCQARDDARRLNGLTRSDSFADFSLSFFRGSQGHRNHYSEIFVSKYFLNIACAWETNCN